jgi:putative transposase
MQKNHRLAKSISDVSWSIFVSMLEYKAEWYGKNIIFIGRFEPSSKICNKCGYHNKNLMLKDRKWTCPDCQTLHDRDVNAAINIKNFALHPQNLIREQIPLHERKLTLGENEVCKIHSMNQESVT